jgi:hypothetical protein
VKPPTIEELVARANALALGAGPRAIATLDATGNVWDDAVTEAANTLRRYLVKRGAAK